MYKQIDSAWLIITLYYYCFSTFLCEYFSSFLQSPFMQIGTLLGSVSLNSTTSPVKICKHLLNAAATASLLNRSNISLPGTSVTCFKATARAVQEEGYEWLLCLLTTNLLTQEGNLGIMNTTSRYTLHLL